MTYIVLAIIASMVFNAPAGMAIGFIIALVVAMAQSRGSLRRRTRQMPGNRDLRAVIAFAVAALVIDEVDDWKILAIAWLIAAFAIGAWRTKGRLAATGRWALLSGFAAAVAGLAMARLSMNWVTTPMAVWFILLALVSASAIRAALRWPDLPWVENGVPTKQRTAGALAGLFMSAVIVGVSVI
jgi:hypothetical protein